MPRLIIENGPKKGIEYKFKNDQTVTLGRSRKNTIPLDDILASRHHARVWCEEGAWMVEDLKSRNGISVNGKRVEKAPLKIGDSLQVGHTRLVLKDTPQGRLAGKEVMGYTLLELIGKGGMGEVYRAHQKSLNRIVAIKVLLMKDKSGKPVGQDKIDSFINEARRAGALNHPNIIRVHDVGQSEDGLVCFSMEYVDGPSLKDWIRDVNKQEEEMPLADLCDIFAKTADALHYAHTMGVVHRDIKPDNIMITSTGEVKLADLGIARMMGEDPEPTQSKDNPRKRQVVGTPHYIAPEQILDRPSDGRLDIYSLGATVYHLLTGHTVFSGKTAREVIKAHLRVSPTVPSVLNEDIPDFLDDIILKMLRKRPSERYQQARDVAEDFRQAAEKLRKGPSRFSLFGRKK